MTGAITLLPSKSLTEREEKFLEALFGEAKGDPSKARRLAGYPNNKPVNSIIKELKEEILERIQFQLASKAPEAVFTLVELMTETIPSPNAKVRLAAALALLDRAGIVKVEKKQVDHTYKGGIALLPPKRVLDDEEEFE